MNILLYSIFDIVFLLFAIVLSIAVGGQFQPNPIVFLIVFICSRVIVYRLWLFQVEKRSTPWLRVLIQSVLLLITIPMIIAASSFFFPAIANNVFWFALVPATNFVPFVVIHSFYKIT